MKTNAASNFLAAHPALPAVLSAIAAFLLYAITMRGTYVYDDIAVVQDDPRVHRPVQWKQLWTGNYNNGGDNLYRPLISSSYAIEWLVHGDRPWIFHLVNVLLHAAVAAAVAEVTRRGMGRSPLAGSAACIAGLLFAAHPVHVEAVAGIVGRAELGCALAVFVGLIVLSRRPFTRQRAVAVVACGVAGILCKEQGILQPLLWGLFGWAVWQDRIDAEDEQLPYVSRSFPERRAITTLVLLTLWIWAGYLIGREHILRFEWDLNSMDPTMQPLMRSVGIDRILMPVILIGRYTALFFWPTQLSLDYGGDVIGFHARAVDPYLWIGFGALVFWGVAVILAWIYRSGFVFFCLIAMAMTYGLVGNILMLIGTNFAERLIYLPSAFLLMAFGAVLVRVRACLRITVVSAALLLWSVKTFTAASDWNDPLLLFQHSLVAAPRSIQVHLLLADEYQRRGNNKAADAILDEVCIQYPNYWRVWMFRSMAALDDADLITARRDLERAIELDHQPILLGVQGRLQQMEAAKKRAATSQ